MSEDRHHQQEPLQFQYRGRSWEGCNFWFFKMNLATRSSFNTEDGRGRAAIKHSIDQKINMNVSIPRTVVGGLQFASSTLFIRHFVSFNTEDGRGRAAMALVIAPTETLSNVSIPRTVVGGLQSDIKDDNILRATAFQYRGRSWEGCNCWNDDMKSFAARVSIPRTVVGGLQCLDSSSSPKWSRRFQYRGRSWEGCNNGGGRPCIRQVARFNTEDGRGRAAIRRSPRCSYLQCSVSIPRTVVGGLQFRCAVLGGMEPDCFNTEDGRGRAAISVSVSITRRLSAFQYRGRSWEGCNQSSSIVAARESWFQYRGRSWEGCNG